MEPARPVVDVAVLDLLELLELSRGDIQETREGVCRIGPELATELASHALMYRKAVAPHVEQVARVLSRREEHPTPLTRTRHRSAIATAVAASGPAT
jgi:hypothetical protein